MVSINQLFILMVFWCASTDRVENAKHATSSQPFIYSDYFHLLWIEENAEEYFNENFQTRSLVRKLISTVVFESDIDNAIFELNRMKYTGKQILLVVSDQTVHRLLRSLAHYDLNDDISGLFVFSDKPNSYQNLMHDKLIGIFTDSSNLIDAIRGFMLITLSSSGQSSKDILDREQKWSRMFSPVTVAQVWYEVFFEILRSLPRDEQAKKEMIEECRKYYARENSELQAIDLFDSHYTSALAIEWYTADSFVHKLVNKALRSENIDLLYAFRFFINDLSADVKQEHSKQAQSSESTVWGVKNGIGSSIKLSSGQLLPKVELNRLMQNVGNIIAVNSFLSTSVYFSKAEKFVDEETATMNPVMIEISFNTMSQDNVNFADIESRSKYSHEREVLFDCGSLFNLTSIKYNSFSEMWEIKMVAIPKSSMKEHPYHTYIRQNFIQNHSATVGFGIVIAHGYGRVDEAIRYFDQLLSSYPSNHMDIPDILKQRAILYEKKGEYKLASRDYEHALNIHRERVKENLLGLASVYSNIGHLQMIASNLSTSLNSHHEAMTIFEQMYGIETVHVTKAKVNEDIGLTYQHFDMLSEALEYFTRAHSAYEQILPEKSLLTSQLLGYMGIVHEARMNFTFAMELFHRQLNLSEGILPADHPLLMSYLESLLRIHIKANQSFNITALFSEHLKKLSKSLGENHPFIVHVVFMTASIYEPSQPMEAIRLYNQVLEIAKKTKPSDQTIILKCHQNLSRMYRSYSNLKDALEHAHLAFTYQQQISSDREDTTFAADELFTIGSIYLEMGSNINALQYLTKALALYQSKLAAEHPTIRAILSDIARAANQSLLNA